MIKKSSDKELSKHHLLPQSRGGVNERRNIELIKDTQHRAIHTLFANQLIAEQLLTTVDISAKALREDVKQWLIDTLTSKDIHDPHEWYDERIIRF